ncbi:MAG: hypothetical protein ABH952_04370 [Candidatus Omnitrophota bacterium]
MIRQKDWRAGEKTEIIPPRRQARQGFLNSSCQKTSRGNLIRQHIRRIGSYFFARGLTLIGHG